MHNIVKLSMIVLAVISIITPDNTFAAAEYSEKFNEPPSEGVCRVVTENLNKIQNQEFNPCEIPIQPKFNNGLTIPPEYPISSHELGNMIDATNAWWSNIPANISRTAIDEENNNIQKALAANLGHAHIIQADLYNSGDVGFVYQYSGGDCTNRKPQNSDMRWSRANPHLLPSKEYSSILLRKYTLLSHGGLDGLIFKFKGTTYTIRMSSFRDVDELGQTLTANEIRISKGFVDTINGRPTLSSQDVCKITYKPGEN